MVNNYIQPKLWSEPGRYFANIAKTNGITTYQRFANAKELGIDGTLLSLPFVAYGVANAPRGYKGAELVSSGITQLVVTPILTFVAALAIQAVLPGIGTGIVVAFAAGGLALPGTSFVETRLNRGMRAFTDIDRNTNKFQLGYTDSPGSQLQRSNAVQEMSGAFGSRRRWLGQEAMHLHQ
jgi:hypothetical protein